jgi:hypothetical protein
MQNIVWLLVKHCNCVGFFLNDLRKLVEVMREVGNAFFEQIKIRLGYLIDVADDRTFEA